MRIRFTAYGQDLLFVANDVRLNERIHDTFFALPGDEPGLAVKKKGYFAVLTAGFGPASDTSIVFSFPRYSGYMVSAPPRVAA